MRMLSDCKSICFDLLAPGLAVVSAGWDLLFFRGTLYIASAPHYYASDTVTCSWCDDCISLFKEISPDPSQTIWFLNKVNIQSYSRQVEGHFSQKREMIVIQKILSGYMRTIMSILHFCVSFESILCLQTQGEISWDSILAWWFGERGRGLTGQDGGENEEETNPLVNIYNNNLLNK